MGSLVWAMFLLFILIYVFAIIFTQAVGDYLNPESPAPSDSFSPENDDDVLRRYFGNLFRSMSTLFASVAGGLGWNDVIEPLLKVSVICVAIFVFYIAFV